MGAGIFLVLAGIFAVGPQPAGAAQQFVCYTLRQGDTAELVALRLTGNPQSLKEAGFQIVDPSAARIIRKTDYARIYPGWQACIATDMLGGRSVPPRRASVGRSSLLYPAALASTVSAMLLAVPLAARHLAKRRAVLAHMKRFGDTFVREFRRPLRTRRHGDQPIGARLRFTVHRKQLDILLAPVGDRRYPNLSDHRRNLEYDVQRVLHVLNDDQFVKGELHAEGPWVVIPFRLTLM